MSDHVRRLRQMADREKAKARSCADASRLALANSGHHERNAQCFLAGAEALEQLQAINEFREENT